MVFNPLMLLLAILMPPVAAFFMVGLTTHFWINLVLTMFGYVPGILHAVWLVFGSPQLI